MVDRPFWDNSLFKVQVEKDRARRPGSCINGRAISSDDVFPVDPTDEEILDWTSRMEMKNQADLVRGTLGDQIPELKNMTDEQILGFTQHSDFD